MKRKVEKIPLLYSMAEEVLLEQLSDKGDEKAPASKFLCAEEFLTYIKSIEFDRDYNKAKNVNELLHQYYSTDKQKTKENQYMRNILQALSFNLTPDQAGEIFHKAMTTQAPNKTESNQKKTGKQVYEQMYKLLNSQ